MNGPSQEKQEIGRKLRDAVKQSRQDYEVALKQFQEIVKDIPSGLPHPDGTARLQAAGREVKRLLAVQHEALAQYTDFLLHGTIPEDRQKH